MKAETKKKESHTGTGGGYNHVGLYQNAYTLCGDTMNPSSVRPLTTEEAKQYVNCPDCLAKIDSYGRR